jgi:hypothetical protein
MRHERGGSLGAARRPEAAAAHPALSEVIAEQFAHCTVARADISPGNVRVFLGRDSAGARRARVGTMAGRMRDGPMLRDGNGAFCGPGSILWLDEGCAGTIEIWASERWLGDFAALAFET